VKRVTVAAVMVLAAGGVMVRGADVTATGTGQVPAAADYSTPKKAIESFLNAVQSTDEKAIKASLVVAPEHQEAVDAYVKLILATNKLQKAAETRFGEQADQYFGVNSKQMESRLKAIEGAEAKMVGDSAIIEIPADETTKQPGGTVVVKKDGGDWKLDAGTLFKLSETPQEQTERAVGMAKKMVPLTEQMTTEIEGGKFASASEAYQAFWQRSLEAVKETAGAAGTQPAGK
jgi:hypothetical protein